MAWIELHQNLPAHRKVKKLKRLLKIKTPQAVGHLAMLWLWAVDNAPDGDLSALDPEDIAEACEWTKDAEQFVQALTEAGFIDPDAKLHDWSDYAGMLLDRRENQREQNRKRQQRYRNKRKADSNAAESNASTQDSNPVTHDDNVSVTHYESVSNAPVTTLPNLTIPNLTLTRRGMRILVRRYLAPTALRHRHPVRRRNGQKQWPITASISTLRRRHTRCRRWNTSRASWGRKQLSTPSRLLRTSASGTGVTLSGFCRTTSVTVSAAWRISRRRSSSTR